MGKFDTYRYLVLRDTDSFISATSRHGKRSHPPKKQQRVFALGLLFLTSITFYIGLYTTTFHPVVEHIASKLGYHEPVFAVIIDAGSTGSRVLAYTFHKSYLGNDIVLDYELFEEIKPGLSSFVDNPQKGAESILKLIDLANNVVPKSYRGDTPLVLRATAGLRLLEPVAAENLLNTVREALLGTGYLVGNDSVDIMDGVDEGICSWFTVNFLQGKLSDDKTSAALDLGGGSTQITYEPHGPDDPDPIVSLPGPHRNISLYTYSYLNLGLMAARKGILDLENNPEANSLASLCINSIVKNQKWRYNNKDYSVSGSQNNILYKESKETSSTVSERIPVVRIDECRKLITTYMSKLLALAPIPKHLSEHNINAFSYYYDRATDAGLIDPFLGGVVMVKDFIIASERECATANVDQPWACFDLTYISLLLQEAFHLSPDTKLELVKKVRGHEISWALGLAYNTLMKSS